jgi:hypothetical protein
MVATRAQQQAVINSSSSNPLNHAGILEVVMGNLLGQGLYVTTISKGWRACYEKLVDSKGPRRSNPHVHSSTCTSYAAVFASPARLLWAHDSRWKLLICPGRFGPWSQELLDRVQRCIGRFADIATLQIAHQRGLPWTPLVARGGALSGDATKLAWLCDEQHCPLPDDIVDDAAGGGSVEMLQWLKQKSFAFSRHSTYTAARRPHNIPVLQYLQNEGCEWDNYVCSAAAEAGDLEQLKWLHQHGATLRSSVPGSAACNGMVNILDWWQQQGFEFDCHVMEQAAQYGQLQACKWLHCAGCPWSIRACFTAVDSGYIETLQYLHENGCPWDDTRMIDAAVNAIYSNVNILQYLWEQSVQPDVAKLTQYLKDIGAFDKLAIAQWLRQHGAQWPNVLKDWYDRPWCDTMVAWARAEGCTAPVGVRYADY